MIIYHNFLNILLLSLVGYASVNGGIDLCNSADRFTVPAIGFIGNNSDYKHIGSAVQVFPELTIPCDGYITEWHFISRNDIVIGLHLAIFRINNTTLEIVGQEHLRAFSIPNGEKGAKVLYKPRNPLRTKKGDMIGILYDDLRSPISALTIPVKSYIGRDLTRANFEPAYIFLANYSQLTSTFRGKLNTNYTVREYRRPALSVVVSRMFATVPAVVVKSGAEEVVIETAAEKPDFYPPIQHAVFHQETDQLKLSTTTPTVPPPSTGRSRKFRTRTTTPAMMESTTVVMDRYINQWLAVAFQTPQTTPHFKIDAEMAGPIYPQRCLNPPVASNDCRKLGMRAYFDFTKGSCVQFYGCEAPDAEANNFDTVQQCQGLCHFPKILSTKSPKFIYPECLEAPTFSNCYFPVVRYYFDAEERKCVSFLGCANSETSGINNKAVNNFESSQDCSTRCGLVDTSNGGGNMQQILNNNNRLSENQSDMQYNSRLPQIYPTAFVDVLDARQQQQQPNRNSFRVRPTFSPA